MTIKQKPLVHLGGTGRIGLREQYEAQRLAVFTALETLCQNRPHGRDYYPLEAGAYEKARKDHEDRINALRSVLRDFEELVEHTYF